MRGLVKARLAVVKKKKKKQCEQEKEINKNTKNQESSLKGQHIKQLN
jgi:hypothetical protein